MAAMYTLGINSVFHDSAACLIRDGELIAAVEEERFTRVRHHKRPAAFESHALPYHSIDYCLKEAGITLGDVDHVGYSYNPFYWIGDLTAEQTFRFAGSAAELSDGAGPDDFAIFLSGAMKAPEALRGTENLLDRSKVPHHLVKRFLGELKYDFHFLDHHLCHAASAFLPSPFQRAAILTVDGAGEFATTTYGTGLDMKVELFGEVRKPNSLGMLWENVTAYLGFNRGSHEYKVMAMGSYAKPVYLSQFQEIIQVKGGGSYVVNPHDLVAEFGPARLPGEPFEQRHFEIAASVQAALESTLLEIVGWLGKETGEENLCIAGGVALNCELNSVIADRGPFKNVWVQPAANDAGTALGAAMLLDAIKRPEAKRNYHMEQAYLGPSYSDEEIEEFLKWAKVPYRKLDDVAKEVAALLADGQIVGWFQGRMEFGPRALGARSILASPIDPTMKDRLNEIKDREDFRPVAPAVLEEKAAEWFVGARPSPFMLFTFPTRDDKIELIPSVQHVDSSARIQTVTRAQNPLYHDLLAAFDELTGVPILINTSFNSRGEPIVCSPRHAVETFWATPLDALAVGPFLVEKAPRRQHEKTPS